MTIIQTYFGVNQKPEILRPEQTIAYPQVPKDHAIIPRYHRFYTFVELVGHAFGGSYSLELLYNKRVIGSFAVLTRGDATQCASCRIRRKAGGEVRGIVDIPDETLRDIAHSVSTEDNVVGALAAAIKANVTVRLVDAAGNLLADTDASANAPGIRQSKNNDGRRLEETIAPKVRLWSAGAIQKLARTPAGEELPDRDVTFFNHQDHGDFFEGPTTWVPR